MKRGMAGNSWEMIRSRAIALAIGLVMGPFLSNYVGWQVTSSSAERQLARAVIEQQALVCEARARAALNEPEKLDDGARRDLAEKWAIMPGRTSALSGVVSACADKLVA